MQNEAVEQLYPMVSVGTPVHITNYANKAGWSNGKLYLESQSPVQLGEAPGPLNNQPASSVINTALKTHAGMVDWSRVNEVASNADGLPEEVGSRPIAQALNQ
jgi:L,D-transpeptidase ErfK/SrfK